MSSPDVRTPSCKAIQTSDEFRDYRTALSCGWSAPGNEIWNKWCAANAISPPWCGEVGKYIPGIWRGATGDDWDILISRCNKGEEPWAQEGLSEIWTLVDEGWSYGGHI